MKRSLVNVSEIIQKSRLILQSKGDPLKAKKLDSYMKGSYKHYGITYPDVKSLFNSFYEENVKDMDYEDQINLSYNYFKDSYFDLKMYGILILDKNIKLWTNPVHYEELGHIVETWCPGWAAIDSLSSTIKKKILIDDSFQHVLYNWSTTINTWKQRLCCVSFVTLAKTGNYTDTIYKICTNTVKNPERFCQLGTGWVLRNLSTCDLVNVKKFIIKNYSLFSREGLRYAVEKMTPKDMRFILDYDKNHTNSNDNQSDQSVDDQKEVSNESFCDITSPISLRRSTRIAQNMGKTKRLKTSK